MKQYIISYRNLQIAILSCLLVPLLLACNPTRRITAEDTYLLEEVTIEQEKKAVPRQELKTYIRQEPNKRVLFTRFHLGMYNLANPEKDNWFHNWLRKIGERPVIYDPLLTERSKNQLRLYLRSKGYYNAEVADSVTLKKKRARVSYYINAGNPYRIDHVTYTFQDSSLTQLVLKDTINTVIREGDLFDLDVLQEERNRIADYLRNQGYYNFTNDHVFFRADTVEKNLNVDLLITVRDFKVRNQDGEIQQIPHPLYVVDSISMNLNYDPRLVIGEGSAINASFDTTIVEDIAFKFQQDKPVVKPRTLIGSNYIVKGSLYSQYNVERTYRHLSALRMFRYVNVAIEEKLPPFMGLQQDTLPLIYNIQLTPLDMQAYTVEVEGTNSSGNIGVAGNFTYQHKNLFRGAEILDFRVKGAIETLPETYGADRNNTVEFGSEVQLRIPKFLLPFRTEKFVKEFNPKTLFSLAYNYQQRPDYTRTIANSSFGYYWRGNSHLNHIIRPVEINLVKLPEITENFQEQIANTYLESSYNQHLVTNTNYSVVYNNQDIKKVTNFIYVRLNLESAGNILTGVNDLIGTEKKDGSYELLGTPYSQYLKSDVDFRFYQAINQTDKLVYRIFAGAGYPYNNTNAMPFEKKYFSGGANSIRAWQVRNLGPGSFSGQDSLRYPNQLADIKLEANIEYRFKLFWIMEGAFFLDAGNIWAINEFDEREGAQFYFDKFYKDIAVGTGVGTRFDFGFFLFRFDLGVKLRDPSINEENKWIIGSRRLKGRDLGFNIGIGYPF